jgi:SAM-dependent methyltransferase
MQSPKGSHAQAPESADPAALYRRTRLAFPPRLVARVAALARLAPGDAVLDLGTGTGMLAIPFAAQGFAVTAMDPDPAMLAQARIAEKEARAAEKEARRMAADAGLAVTWRAGGSADLSADMGPFRLAVIGRAFHWMDRAATLAMLERIVTADGAVALFHDAHPPVAENEWFGTVCRLVKRYGVDEGRDGGHRRYEPFLFASAFRRIESASVTVRHTLTVEDIVGRAFTLTRCQPARLGARAGAFADALRAALLELSPDGRFTEVAELVAVVARRPADQANSTFTIS